MKPSRHLIERANQRGVDLQFIAKTASRPEAIVECRSGKNSRILARKFGGQYCVVVVEDGVLLTTYWSSETQSKMFDRKRSEVATKCA